MSVRVGLRVEIRNRFLCFGSRYVCSGVRGDEKVDLVEASDAHSGYGRCSWA